MAAVSIRQFRGATLRPDARLLAPQFAQVLRNGRTFRGSLTPLEGLLQAATPTKVGTIQTIYRFGADIQSDTQYWLNWTTDVDVVRGPIAGDTTEKTYFTGDGVPKVTDNSLALGADYPNAAYALGIPVPAATTTLVVNGVGEGLAETRVYVVCYVSGWGELGSPSLATASVDVKKGQTVTLNNLPMAPAGNYNITAKRIFRAVLGTTGVEYLFVKEVPVALASTIDDVLAAGLGEALPSLGWIAPPAGLKGLTSLPNGILAGFVGRDLYFCHPFHPYAWPVKYMLTTDYPIVGLGVVDSTLVVLTTGVPYYVSGTDPSAMAMVGTNIKQACVSKQGIVSAFGGVIYPTPDGLMYLTPGNEPRSLTDPVFAPGQWQAIKPSSIRGYLFEGYYVGFYDNGAVQGGFMISLDGDWTDLNFYATAGYNDLQRDILFLVSGGQIQKFAKGPVLTQTWRSKQFYFPDEPSLACARVEATGYPVTFRYYINGVLRHTKTVLNAGQFRLPPKRGTDFEFEVEGTTEIRAIVAASSAEELGNA